MQGLQGKFDFESLGKGVLDNLRQVSPAAGVFLQPIGCMREHPFYMVPGCRGVSSIRAGPRQARCT